MKPNFRFILYQFSTISVPTLHIKVIIHVMNRSRVFSIQGKKLLSGTLK